VEDKTRSGAAKYYTCLSAKLFQATYSECIKNHFERGLDTLNPGEVYASKVSLLNRSRIVSVIISTLQFSFQ